MNETAGGAPMAVTVGDFYKAAQAELALEVEAGAAHFDRPIQEIALHRPGLALAGFLQFFPQHRLQVLGLSELSYLKSLAAAERRARLEALCGRGVPGWILARNRHAPAELLEAAAQHGLPVLRSALITGRLVNSATMILEDLSAPEFCAQGTMVDILGIGVLIEGRPGIGKSETALALIERGHALVADDVTRLRRTSSRRIVGQSLELTRFHMEIRGLGIVHVPSLYGAAATRMEMPLDLIVELRAIEEMDAERMGVTPALRRLLGLDVPVLTLPVAAGRDLAHVIEVAALNQKLKNQGYDAARELDEQLMARLARRGAG
ncbi:MAG: HPr(Ser) kinase/phosphatase [Candidatus Marinimicrobia bacterium]|nr:HPr(Ser) kinase/phosphatase [Candidatus Neomarinimicrobiota bacterium]